MASRPEFDAVVVGASIAGCTTARLLGLAGARVALVDRRPDPAAYKVVCTHQIQRSATPTIGRLGLAPLLDARGAVKTHPEAWAPGAGWIRFPTDIPHGYGVTRRTLDPMLRELAAQTPGVALLLGQTAVALREGEGGVAGIEIEDRNQRRRSLGSRLVVGADGRHSAVARLGGLRGRARANSRFCYFAYWRGIRPRSTHPRLWFLDPDAAAVFPNEDDLSVVAAVPHRSRLSAFRADPERGYADAIARLPDGPDLAGAQRESKLIGVLDVPNVRRPPIRPGVALVGDAALTADPLFGVGCGWALQTGEWLADAAGAAVTGEGDLDRALGRYRRRLLLRLGPHQLQIADYSTGRRLRLNERLAFRGAANDSRVARAVEQVAARHRSPLRLLDPVFTLRTLRAAARA